MLGCVLYVACESFETFAFDVNHLDRRATNVVNVRAVASLTTETALRVLLVDDSSDDAEIVTRELRRGGRDVVVERVCEAETMRAALARQGWDLVISDWTMPTFSGGAALELLKAEGVDAPFIIFRAR